jgi:elongation factor Ts
MVEITAELVKTLRARTGIGMAKCKEALAEANGDIELAIQNLRKAGIASAVKKAGREANEGKIIAAQDDRAVALVEVNAETDFVVKNEKFQEFATTVAQEALTGRPSSLEAFMDQVYSHDRELTIDQYRAVTIQSLGENIVIRRVELVEKKPNHSYGIYSHMGGKIVTLVVLEGAAGEEEFAREVGMHVAATNPEHLDPEAVPASVRQQEEEIARAQLKGKPENMIPKILEGKMRAYYEQHCLVNQPWIKENKMKVSEVVEQRGKEIGKPLKIALFRRWTVGSA